MNYVNTSSTVMTITPAIARQMLDTSQGNRTISLTTVSAYARDMKNGYWKLTGDTIKVGKAGQLRDGHHRLLAAIEADATFNSYVVFGIDDDAVMAIDSGRKRSVGDHLHFRNEKNANALAASVRALFYLATREYGRRLTNADVCTIVDHNPLLRESVAKCHDCSIGPQAAWSALHYIGSHVQGMRDRADAFYAVLDTGVPDYDGCPAHLLREKIISAKVRGVTLQTSVRYALTANAWAHFAAETPLKLLRPVMDFTIRRLSEPAVFSGDYGASDAPASLALELA